MATNPNDERGEQPKAERVRLIAEFAIAVIVAPCVAFLVNDAGVNLMRSALVAAIGAGASLATVVGWRLYLARHRRIRGDAAEGAPNNEKE